MATQQIFEGEVRTELGTCTVRIYDTDTDGTTPDLWYGDIIGGIDLQQGDTGQSGEGLPIGVFGSFFDLDFVDNPQNEFRDIFNSNFANQRYRVELEFPSTSYLNTWYGYVQPDISQRPVTERTQKNTASITCADGLGNLKEEPRIENTRTLTVTEFFARVANRANPELDVGFYSDSRGNEVGVIDQPVGLEFLVPNEAPLGTFSPLTGDHKGLEGSTVREQLENLCETFHAAFYQDITLDGNFVFMDVAAIGHPVNGGELFPETEVVNNLDFPDHRITLETPRDEGEDVLEPETSVSKVCVNTPEFSLDPNFEQYDDTPPTKTGLYWVAQDGAELQFTNNQTETQLRIFDTSNPEFNVFIGVDLKYIDAVRIATEGAKNGVAFRAVYGDGTSDTKTVQLEPMIIDLDPNKKELRRVVWEFFVPVGLASQLDIKSYTLELLQSEDVVQPDGSTETEYTRTETICFVDDGDGRIVKETNNLNYVTRRSDGSRSSSDGYFSRRYTNVGNLARWRAINILSLLKPGIERLRNVALGQWLPLGTRVYWTKPGEQSQTPFVHQTGRTLKIGSDVDAGTVLNELEVSSFVEGRIIEFITEEARATVDLTPSVTESVGAGTASESASIGVSLTPSVTESAS